MRILVIEDEKRLAFTLADMIGGAGYYTDISHDGAEGLELAKTGIYDAIVLDVMLPGMDGYEVLEKLRSARNMAPVLMLTARSELADRVRGLDTGADYYLTKPFATEEFLACLRTVLRRHGDIAPDTLSFGDLILTPSTPVLICGENSVSLSARELELMSLLIQNSSQYLPKETILLKVWGYDANVNSTRVPAYPYFMHKTLSLLGSCVSICVMRHIGYKLEVSL